MNAEREHLLSEIQAALREDVAAHELKAISKAELVTQARDALHRDEVAAAEDDEHTADEVLRVVPNLEARLQREHAGAQSQIEQQFPWCLTPLEYGLDLLSPLARARSEVIHTQALAYLLNPREAHGLGIRCLRELFSLLGRRIRGDDMFEQLSRESEENNERLRRFNVNAERRVDVPADTRNDPEERRCDIWLEMIEEDQCVAVIIENKIDAGEHTSQLSAYEGALFEWARRNRCLRSEKRLVFLTPDGRQPQSRADQNLWVSIGYKELAAALAHACRDAPEPGRTFLMLYVSTILKHVLDIRAQPGQVHFAKQLRFMRAVIDHGAPHE